MTPSGLPRPHPNCYWVDPDRLSDRLLAGEYPGDRDEAEAREKLRRLLSAGRDFFLDLTEPYEAGIIAPLQPYDHWLADEARALGVAAAHTRLSIPDMGLPENPAHMARILDTLDAALAAGRKVYLHCWGGIGRTGTVVGCYLVRHGRTGDEALETLDRWWRTVLKSLWAPRSPQTDEQVAYVRAWREPAARR